MRTLAELAGGDPLVLIFSRGWWCPKEQRYLRALTGLQDELEVAFLSDAQRDWLPRLGLLETTDTLHRPYRPAGFTLFPDLTIHGAYNGYWYWGRATMEELQPGHACHLAGAAAGLGGVGGVSAAALPFAHLVFDGERLSADPHAPGRRLRIDARCLQGEPVAGRSSTSARSPTATRRCASTSPRRRPRAATRSHGGSRCWAPSWSASPPSPWTRAATVAP